MNDTKERKTPSTKERKTPSTKERKPPSTKERKTPSTKENNALSTKEIAQVVLSEESIGALNSAFDVIKKEYGDFKLTQEMRQNLANELGETAESADGWQTVAEILDHIDINELAKKHPDAIGKISKVVLGIVCTFVPAASAAQFVSEDFLVKLIEYAGILTPEHLVNILVKKQAKKSKAKREQAHLLDPDEETTSKGQELKEKLSAGYKNATQKLAKPFSKKNTPQEDILETIKKLSELKDSNIITQEEFEAKKTELLSKL